MQKVHWGTHCRLHPSLPGKASYRSKDGDQNGLWDNYMLLMTSITNLIWGRDFNKVNGICYVHPLRTTESLILCYPELRVMGKARIS